MKQPRARVGPPAFGSGFGDAQNFSGLLDFQPDEVPELDQFGLLRFELSETVEGVVERQQLVIRRWAGNFDLIGVQVLGTRTAALAVLAPCAINEDAAHGFGSGPKKMRAVLP